MLHKLNFKIKVTKYLHKNPINTLTANYEYSRNNTDDLLLPVQMQLSAKLKTISPVFIALLESF